MIFFLKKKEKEKELEVPLAPPELETEENELNFPEMPETKIKIQQKPVQPKLPDFQEPILEHEQPSKPLFIDVADFKEVLEEIGLIKTILSESDDASLRAEDFTAGEDKEFNKWKSIIKDIQKNLVYCEKTLFR